MPVVLELEQDRKASLIITSLLHLNFRLATAIFFLRKERRELQHVSNISSNSLLYIVDIIIDQQH